VSITALIGDAALRATPVLALVLVFCGVRPHSAPALRHVTLAFGLFAFLVMPAARLLLPVWLLPLPAWLLPLPDAASRLIGTGTHLADAPALSVLSTKPVTVATIIQVIWVAGTLLLLGRVVMGIAGVFRLRATGSEPACIYGPAGLRRLRVATSGAVDVPLVVGFLRPVVLLPVAAAEWPAGDRKAVLAHEVAHILRGDAWTLLLASLVRAVYWPNPLVWMAARRLRMTSEEACDQAVIAAGVPPATYAQLLLRLAREGMHSKLPGLALCMTRPRGLGRRIELLVHASPRRVGTAQCTLTIAVLFVAIGCLGAARVLPSAAAYAARYGISEVLAGQIMRAADAELVHRALAFGLVSVESGFDAERSSPRGAVGLTQILPGTAADIAPHITHEMLRDPYTNLRIGFRLLHQYMVRFNGDRERALIAYNSGPAHAGRADAVLRSAYPQRVLRAVTVRRP
jgi:beta-lactamase regulating signal transducer with metallopeptidase domain